MEKDIARIADKINIDNLTFCMNPRSHRDRAVVSFALSNKLLYFNPKMTKLLSMRDWKNAVVGYDRQTKVIVLKQCEASEFGSVVVRIPSKTGSRGEKTERDSQKRTICVGAVSSTLGICTRSNFRAERNGNMIFLEGLAKEKE